LPSSGVFCLVIGQKYIVATSTTFAPLSAPLIWLHDKRFCNELRNTNEYYLLD
jgi:hypothetical protein